MPLQALLWNPAQKFHSCLLFTGILPFQQSQDKAQTQILFYASDNDLNYKLQHTDVCGEKIQLAYFLGYLHSLSVEGNEE
jgi:hypothetical protein